MHGMSLLVLHMCLHHLRVCTVLLCYVAAAAAPALCAAFQDLRDKLADAERVLGQKEAQLQKKEALLQKILAKAKAKEEAKQQQVSLQLRPLTFSHLRCRFVSPLGLGRPCCSLLHQLQQPYQ